MAGPRQPIGVIVANGKSHLTRAQIEERTESELAPCTDEIEPPKFLTATEKKRFLKIANQLKKLKILGETDCDTLARYVTAQGQYEKATRALRKLINDEPDKEKEGDGYFAKLDAWASAQEHLAGLQDKYFKQAQAAANSMGLTITSRCKIAAPVTDKPEKVNKFAALNKASG